MIVPSLLKTEKVFWLASFGCSSEFRMQAGSEMASEDSWSRFGRTENYLIVIEGMRDLTTCLEDQRFLSHLSSSRWIMISRLENSSSEFITLFLKNQCFFGRGTCDSGLRLRMLNHR